MDARLAETQRRQGDPNHLRLPKELVSRLDSIIVSQEEIALCRDTVEAVGANRLGVITMGQDGAKVIYGGQRANIPAFKVDVADHTGAGDTFAAAFFIGATDRASPRPKPRGSRPPRPA